MPRSKNQKLKILYILEALKKTDENNIITVNALIELLASNGIIAERKSVYADLEALELFGYDIIRTKGKNCGVFLGQREFELPELKLLVDAVQSSKFITEQKSARLIEKLAALAGGGNQTAILKRQVVIHGRIKTQNESIFNSIDRIHTAISENRMISFSYYTYKVENGKIKKIPRQDGKKYIVSPWSLTWDDEFYYLLAHDEKANMIKHFRVDKMADICPTRRERRGKLLFGVSGISGYTKSTFSMFGGEDESVRISCDNDLISVIIDRYGSDITILKESDDRFVVTAKVKVSPQFLAWVFSFGKGMEIVYPDNVVMRMKQLLEESSKLYSDK
ncbi:MAG: WYL domain-containing protein [Firmicutes bacterium HGW-Firmicutes-21]|nr:MAG: WYL domain-containing protein [Firmicutes bacterium HGW-Firmicutes-21]